MAKYNGLALGLVALAFSITAGFSETAASGDPPVDFNRDVRPILSEACFQCHGPDANTREAELRLDTREGLFDDRGGYAVVVAGKTDASEMVARITSDDDSLRMPPADSGRSLTPSQIDLIRRWVAQGGEWKGHWAYIPPMRTAPPQPPDPGGFVRNDIDRFILAKLQELDLSPSPEADRVTLLRRLSFDLTGLPPRPEDVQAFLADESASAYEKAVDRLLESPHFGERMAMYWLDLVRYADTNGIHGDNHRDVALYRDYVIRAFNENKPYDEFTIEQLAGDLLPEAGIEQKIASGYNRLLMTTREGGAQPKEYLAKYAADRVRNTSTVWLGATLGCAECHDHKYDPYLTKDFYRFEAFFADLREVAVGKQPPFPVPSPEQAARLKELDRRMAALRKELETPTPELAAAQAEWERSLKTHTVEWTPLVPAEWSSKNGVTLTVAEDGVITVGDAKPDRETYALVIPGNVSGITGFRLDVLPDDSLPNKGPGRAGNGNFVVNEFQAFLDGQPLEWSKVTASHSQKNWDVAGAADGKPETGWAILDETGKANHAVFEMKADLDVGSQDAELKLVIQQNYGSSHLLGKFRLSATTSPRPIRAEGADDMPSEIAELLRIEPEDRTDRQQAELAAYYRTKAPLLEPVRKQLAALEKKKKQLNGEIPTTLISMTMEPRTIRVLPRGNWLDDSGEIVAPGVPEFLPAIECGDQRATRLDLARWLVDPENPLVARVFVNRLWKLMFGRGIVSTLDDFGSQGAWPTHPKLLDWLALEFIDSGWDVKHMLRLMVTSGTYRQSSSVGPELRKADPFNKWLARQGRFRMDAEMVRDNALAVSGLLSTTIGGPSVKPYQPAGYWAHLNFPKRTYQHSTGEDLYRRTLYTYWCRTFLHPSLLAFDAPTREECTVERPRSNNPLQALVLLNDPIYVEAARVFAERILREGGTTPDEQLNFAFQTALQRAPRPEEREVLTSLWKSHREQYDADPDAARQLMDVGEFQVPDDADPAELAAWTSVARVLLNLHESLTRY